MRPPEPDESSSFEPPAVMEPAVAAVLACLSLLAAVGAYCLRRVVVERRATGEVAATTAWLIWTFYLGYTACALAAAWFGMWPLPLQRSLAIGLGLALLGFGLALAGGGMWAFRSIARISGRSHDVLIQHGVYRWTRNPQNVGWGATLLGLALVGRSGLALLLALCFIVAFRLYVHSEERHMERSFGEQWRRYRDRTPRFLGLSSRKRDASRRERPSAVLGIRTR